MIRWLTLALGVMLLVVGIFARSLVHSPRPLRFEDALDPTKSPQSDYVVLTGRPDLSHKLYAVHENTDIRHQREWLSPYPPDHGLPLLLPDSPPETLWSELIDADVVVARKAAEPPIVIKETQRSSGVFEGFVLGRFLVPLDVEKKNLWALSDAHGSFATNDQTDLSAEQRSWLAGDAFTGRLHRFNDVDFGGRTPAEIGRYVEANLPSYANVADAWVIAEKESHATRNWDSSRHFYVPVEGSDAKIWLQVSDAVDASDWDQRVGNTLAGLWLPPGSHQFIPNPQAPTSVALLQLDGKRLKSDRPKELESLLEHRWEAHWGRYAIWLGAGLSGLAALLFLYWHLYSRLYQTGVPDWLRPFERYLLQYPAWRIHLRVGSGLLFAALALVFLGAGMTAQDNMRFNRSPWSEQTLQGIAMAASFGFIAFVTLSTSLLAPGVAGLLKKDIRQPVLYLRAFSTDAMLWDTWQDFLRSLLTGLRDTAERALARAVRDIGPLLAVGKYGERIPPVGAARLYVDRDHWQEVVKALAAEARLVILRIGRTKGLHWEIRHLVETADPRKVFLFLPPGDRGELYAAFREDVAGWFPRPFPNDLGKALFLGFGADWTPYLLAASGPSAKAAFRRCVLHAYLAPALSEALRKTDVLSGMAVRPLRLSVREKGIAFLYVAIVLKMGLTILR